MALLFFSSPDFVEALCNSNAKGGSGPSDLATQTTRCVCNWEGKENTSEVN